uniref:Uncharacterized protein n=1 Tax=Physcomitrium patens TaxID=3218 RepID=A0A2K1K4J5_PHYPA|nr:hypothetical protein PHYPA_013173 [Physcomitrium patens]
MEIVGVVSDLLLSLQDDGLSKLSQSLWEVEGGSERRLRLAPLKKLTRSCFVHTCRFCVYNLSIFQRSHCSSLSESSILFVVTVYSFDPSLKRNLYKFMEPLTPDSCCLKFLGGEKPGLGQQ